MDERPIRVLHVEDDPEFADLTATFLERESDRFTVETAANADEGLDRIRDCPPDCVVSDYDMPGMNGIEFLRAVRRQYPNLPLILFTGKGSEAVASDAISAGATDYLQKETGPSQYRVLAKRIIDAVAHRHARTSYREIFEKVPDGIVIHDPSDCSFIDMNDEYAEMFGYDREEFLQAGFNVIHTDEDPYTLAKARQRVQQVVDGGPQTFEWPVVKRDGTQFWTEVHLASVRLHGRDCILAVVRDITDRKQIQADVDWHRTIIRQMREGVYVLDADYEFRFVNFRDQGPDALSETDWRGRSLSYLVETGTLSPDEAASIRDGIDRVLAGDATEVNIEIEPRWPQTDKMVEIQLSRLTTSADEAVALATTQDITDQTERKRELQRQRDRYRSLFENNPLIIWEEDFSSAVEYVESIASDVNDVESYLLENPQEIDRLMQQVEIVDVNQNAVDYYDAPSKDVLLENADQVFAEETVEPLAAAWAAIAAGRRHFRIETVSRTFSGEKRNELLDVFVPESHAEDYSRVYFTSTDITEAKEHEHRLELQNERLDQFASVVSHDLRNPLEIAEGRLELAREECDSPHLQDVANAHERMERLIDDLLTFALAGSEAIDCTTVALDHLLAECWETVRTDDATLVIETEQAVRADRSRLQQLSENLLTNAVEHGGANVSITVGSLDDGFYIEDDGPGIPEDERTEVFEAGYSAAQEGTGFGLSIVKQVAEAHGWDIRLTDGSAGGTRFVVTGVELVE